MYTIRVNFDSALANKDAAVLAESLGDIALSSSVFRKDKKDYNDWVVEWLVKDKPEKAVILARLSLQAAAYDIKDNSEPKNITIEQTPDINWLEKTYREFAPFSIGPFFIYGSHYKKEPPKSQIGMQIDATTAFGSGEHETTKGCLQAMLDLKSKGVCPWNILDMGTGSGILAIAAWKLWKSPILAVDNDDESIIVTKRHAKMNGVSLSKSGVWPVCGDGFSTPEVDKQKPYELIIMNILAAPVIEMAPDAARVLDENGYCILSGMLNSQADLVASSYEGLGLEPVKRYDLGEWTTLVLHNRNR